jgi:ABC-type multidrug transport system fused ATPase/permease subunit
VAVFGSAVYAFGTVASTVVLGQATDRVLGPTFDTGQVPTGTLMWILLAILAVTTLRASGVVARRYFAGMTAARAERTFHHRLSGKYLGLPLSWHQRTSTGRLLAHADSDVQVMVEALHPLPFSLGVTFLAIMSAVSLLIVDPVLALVGFSIFPALTVLNRFYSRRVERPASEVQNGVGRVSTIAHESFEGALVVKTLGRADAEVARFDDAVQQLRRSRVEVARIRATFEPILDSLPNLGIVLVIIVGALRIDDGAITTGDLVQVASLFTVLAFPMRVLGFFLESLPPTVVARERLEGVLEEPDPARPSQPLSLPTGPLAISVGQVDFHYPDPGLVGSPNRLDDVEAPSGVLNGVDFEVEPSEVVAVVGSTGSGKSTLCLLLAGLVPPTAGTIKVGGVPLDRVQSEDLAASISLVFQESFLFADTLRANIDLDGTADDNRLAQVAAVAQVDEFLGVLPNGWDTVLGERGVTLSGGQRQRVALARALLRNPQVLLLDDATSAVDPKIELEILNGLRGEHPPTTLIVAQRVSTIELADRVLYLADGRIAAAGTHATLMDHPGYRALVEAYEAARQ